MAIKNHNCKWCDLECVWPLLLFFIARELASGLTHLNTFQFFDRFGHFWYDVKSVTHNIRKGEYKQRFTLSREGTGTLTPLVRPS